MKPRLRAALVTIIGLGVAFTILNRDLPIVRNSLLYARISQHLTRHHLRVWEVCDRPALVADKACGFPILSAPFIAAWGGNVGLKLGSCLGTALFVLCTLRFLRRFNRRLVLDDDALPLELLVVCWNPLVIYQFWSAYPDSWFFALFIESFTLLDTLLLDERGGDLTVAAAYLGAILLAIFVKPWALAIFPLHATFAWWHRDELRVIMSSRRRRLVLAGLAYLGAVGFVVLARFGANPLLNIASNSSQYDTPVPYLKSVTQVAWFLAITLGALLALAPLVRIGARDAVLAVCAILYAHIFMVYSGATFNARYFVPLLPFAAPYVVQALGRLRRRIARRGLAGAFLIVNAVAILLANDQTAFRALAARRPGAFAELGYLDNLRIGAQLAMARRLHKVNETVEPNGRVYYVSNYYGTIAYHVYERLGLLRRDLSIVHTPRMPDVTGAWAFYPDGGAAGPGAGAESLGDGLYRIRPVVARR